MISKLPIAKDDSERRVVEDIETHGWHLIAVMPEQEAPGFVYSIGLEYSYGHPEICLFGLSSNETMFTIVNDIGAMIKSGQTFQAGSESRDILNNYPCRFESVKSQFFADYFGYARWLYQREDFRVNQCLWPDSDENFPDQSECQPGVSESQPILF